MGTSYYARITYKGKKELPATIESIESISPIAKTLNYRGLYKPGMILKEEDVVTRDDGEYVYVNGKLVHLEIL